MHVHQAIIIIKPSTLIRLPYLVVLIIIDVCGSFILETCDSFSILWSRKL